MKIEEYLISNKLGNFSSQTFDDFKNKVIITEKHNLEFETTIFTSNEYINNFHLLYELEEFEKVTENKFMERLKIYIEEQNNIN